MTFRNRLQYFLVKKLQISNKEALRLIIEKNILVNGKSVSANLEIKPDDEIWFNNQMLKVAIIHKSYAYYKPKGIETTLNSAIEDNIKDFWPFESDYFPFGRLDKASEGLLIVSNNGRNYDKILRHENYIEKEYIVRLNKPITENFIAQMQNGIVIMGKKTLACEVEKIDEYTFKICLIQGLNRQIRRMCYKLGYEVVNLKRVRIGNVLIEDLKPGNFRIIENE